MHFPTRRKMHRSFICIRAVIAVSLHRSSEQGVPRLQTKRVKNADEARCDEEPHERINI